MEDLLTDVGLEENKERTIRDPSKETVDDCAILEQTKAQAMDEYNGRWAFARVPCWWDTHKIVKTVATAECHTRDTNKQLLHDKVAESDKKVMNQWAPPNADRVESEESWPRVEI